MLPSSVTQNYGNKLIVAPIAPADPNFSKNPIEYMKKFLLPNSNPRCELRYNPLLDDNLIGDITGVLENQSAVMVGMPNYAFYMTLDKCWFLSINDLGNILVMKSDNKYEIAIKSVQALSRGPPNIWYPVLVTMPSYLTQIFNGELLGISLLPNAENLGTNLSQAIEKLLDNSNASYEPDEKTLLIDRSSIAFSSNTIIGAPIYYTNKCKLFNRCSNEFSIGEVNGVASINQAVAYSIKKLKLPTTYSEAVLLANQLGVGNLFTSLIDYAKVFYPVLYSVTNSLIPDIESLGIDVDDMIVHLGIDIN
ncbi:hypothetical protein SJAV_21570 [Sulfurisphaera javensis]|uniref:Uncharacterized protein n=1 Tax=Sulfurisphaera javensis TaxID=2049879 RepID=A0AAT9GTS5_9CREN